MVAGALAPAGAPRTLGLTLADTSLRLVASAYPFHASPIQAHQRALPTAMGPRPTWLVKQLRAATRFVAILAPHPRRARAIRIPPSPEPLTQHQVLKR